MKSLKPYLLAIIPFGISLLCFGLFASIGSTVTDEGLLVEPFFLIPLGYIFFLISFITLLIILIRQLLKK